MYLDKTIAVVIPALNEELSIGTVVNDLMALRDDTGAGALIDDIVVCDNGSTDSTATIARSAGARVVQESKSGYGAACLAGIAALNPIDIVVFVDADNSAVVEELPYMVSKIPQGADLVIGSRSAGNQIKGALTTQQRFGNWLASLLIRKLWNHPITDLGPFRTISFDALRELQMQDQAFGWTVEMQVKAIQRQMNVVEVPVTTNKRIGRSKISGTLLGTIGAAVGIFGMIFRLYREEKQNRPAAYLSSKSAENTGFNLKEENTL